jgi:SecD/SecF fusion protein
MNRSHLWKFLLIVFVVGWAASEMFPLKSRPLVEVFQENYGNRDQSYSNIMARFGELQKANPQAEYRNLRDAIGTNDLARHFEIDTKGEKDPTSAILNALQKKAAGKIKLGLDLQGGSSFLVRMQTTQIDTNATTTREMALANAVEVLRKRVDKFGVAEPLIQPQGNDRILIQMPGLGEAEMESVRTAIQKAAFLEFRMVHDDSGKLIQDGIVPPGYEILKETRTQPDGTKIVVPFLVSKQRVPGLSGHNVKSAFFTRGTMNDPRIAFRFDSDGTVAFGRITTENVGKQLAIILDGELYSAPVIKGPITEGSGEISGGSMTDKEASDLAAILENPLEAPVEIEQETKVDPSLGKDTIRSGIQASIYGTVAVAVFMVIYYFFGGLVANLALCLNIVISLGVMCMFGTTLTLPGIAGLLLSIGMAVDANVLIFERIREELAKGKSLRGALAAGYDRAFGTILDSHVTTLISSIILIYLGTGTIKGFGVTLTIGVAASLFTAVVVTRLIFDLLIARGWMKSIPMMNLVKVGNVDFVRWGKAAAIASAVVIVIGLGYSFTRGKNMLGFEFLGGDNLTLAFNQKVEQQKLNDVLEPAVGEALIQYQRETVGTIERLRVTTQFNMAEKVTNALTASFPEAGFKLIGSERVGPTIGEEILRSAVIAVLLSLLGILIYVSFRYQVSFAVGAVIAVLHDVLVTVGIYALAGLFGEGRQFNSTMIAALLTIIGYSINDKVVILDRIREDLKLGVRGTFKELINLALNQTLGRTIITGGSVILATMSLLVFGGGAINDFAFTFLVGILVGTYSSIYIATAVVLWWHKGQRPTTSTVVTMETTAAGAKA